MIKAQMAMEDPLLLSDLKSKVWDALAQNLPLPDIAELLHRPLTAIEIYYLLERFATLTIWDVYNLEAPGEKHLLQLEGASKHYHVYDRGSCIIAGPKDLFSHERSLEDALQTARAMSREVYKRGWAIEYAGFDKMARASWIELQLLVDQHGRQLEILHYTPSPEDLKIYEARVNALSSLGKSL